MSRKKQKDASVQQIGIGSRVWVERLKDHGSVVALNDDGRRAVVELGKVRFNLELSSLAPGREKPKMRGRKEEIMRPVRRSSVAREVDMHGLRVEEMLVRLDQFLNEALLGGADEVRIIHGHGSGALKKALHQRLKAMGIRHFRLGEPGQTPGGEGVTIVSL
ncbi:MAG: Smr/MutS family protein [bacterium]